jgi:hypothetical protein
VEGQGTQSLSGGTSTRALGYAPSMGRPGFRRQATGLDTSSPQQQPRGGAGRGGQGGGEEENEASPLGSSTRHAAGAAGWDQQQYGDAVQQTQGGTPEQAGDEARPWSLGGNRMPVGAASAPDELILDEAAAERRVNALQQLAAMQKRALEALAGDRASLEAALGVGQRRFKAELDARRGSEAAAAATVSALADERAKLDAARAAYTALLAGADGATELGAQLQALKESVQDAAHELVAQRALAEDAAHELDSCEGRVRWECALEREQLVAAQSQQVVDLERAISRLRTELDHVTAQQSWELERMAAAAEQTAAVSADALGQADARKRDLEGVNDAMTALSERLYVGSISIGAVTAAVDSATAAAMAHLVSAPHDELAGDSGSAYLSSPRGGGAMLVRSISGAKRGGAPPVRRSQPGLDMAPLNGSSFDDDMGGDGGDGIQRGRGSVPGQGLQWPSMGTSTMTSRKGGGGGGGGGTVVMGGTMPFRHSSPAKQRPGGDSNGGGGAMNATAATRASSPQKGRGSPTRRWNNGTGTGTQPPKARRRGRLPVQMLQ